jgi:predicted nucleic acid-binding Zn ribbon protein
MVGNGTKNILWIDGVKAVVYDFKCVLCGQITSIEMSVGEYMAKGNPKCKPCKVPTTRYFGNQRMGIDFSKGGSGFYKNDYGTQKE